MITNLTNRYDICWVGRCQYEGSDKIWGWFNYIDPTLLGKKAIPDYAYVFWGATGKTLQFKRHKHNTWSLNNMVRLKISRKYKQISIEEFYSHWDDLFTVINDRFVFHLLANDI